MSSEEKLKQLEEILDYYKYLQRRKPQFLDIIENQKDIVAMTYAIECVKEKLKGVSK